MTTKIDDSIHMFDMNIGDILSRFPSDKLPEELFDETRPLEIDTFEITSINYATKIIGLVMCGNSICSFPSAGDYGRLFIKQSELIKQDIWWTMK